MLWLGQGENRADGPLECTSEADAGDDCPGEEPAFGAGSGGH